MHQPNNSAETSEADGDLLPRRLLATMWFWRPWYAKLWWAGTVFYWSGKIASQQSFIIADLYASAFAGILNIVFFPPVAVMILGVGFVRSWWVSSNWDFVEPTDEEMFPKRSVGGYFDPMADSLDPRSPKHWRYLDDIE